MYADSTDSPRRVTWRHRGTLGVALLLLLGGCATRAPLPGLLPGAPRPQRRATPPPPPASVQADPWAPGTYAAPTTPTKP